MRSFYRLEKVGKERLHNVLKTTQLPLNSFALFPASLHPATFLLKMCWRQEWPWFPALAEYNCSSTFCHESNKHTENLKEFILNILISWPRFYNCLCFAIFNLLHIYLTIKPSSFLMHFKWNCRHWYPSSLNISACISFTISRIQHWFTCFL